MYVPCIFLGINPRVTCVTRSQSLVRDWQGRSLSDSQRSYRSDVVFMRNKCTMQRSTMRYVSTFKRPIRTHSSMRLLLKRQRLMRETALNTKTIKPHTEERIARLRTTIPSYLLMPLINVGPVARIKAISVANVANLTSEATVRLWENL